MAQAKLGIIGGTGLGDVLAGEGGEAIAVTTPFGPPSADPILADWEGASVAFIARHGLGHQLNPSAVPYRANIWALKELGVQTVLASGATGSLREEIHPGELVVCDQVIDKTFRRPSTFFDQGLVGHIELAEPFCPRLRGALLAAAAKIEATVHPSGTYVCMEGPQFSTRAESHMHRAWGGDLIGMTCMPEAKLAREAELCYALVALPTDYDCWRPPEPGGGEGVLQTVLANLKHATAQAISLMKAVMPHLAQDEGDCGCREALKLALWSDPRAVQPEAKERLDLLVAKYLRPAGEA